MRETAFRSTSSTLYYDRVVSRASPPAGRPLRVRGAARSQWRIEVVYRSGTDLPPILPWTEHPCICTLHIHRSRMSSRCAVRRAQGHKHQTGHKVTRRSERQDKCHRMAGRRLPAFGYGLQDRGCQLPATLVVVLGQAMLYDWPHDR